jgi:hypothetical protein
VTYAPDHADVVATLAEDGAAVTFTRTSPGTYDATTDTYTTPTTSTVAGYAVQDDAGAQRKAGEVIAEGNVVLLFTPSTRGSLPTAGYTTTWNSTAYTVMRTFREINPDGAGVIAAYVELAR